MEKMFYTMGAILLTSVILITCGYLDIGTWLGLVSVMYMIIFLVIIPLCFDDNNNVSKHRIESHVEFVEKLLNIRGWFNASRPKRRNPTQGTL